VHRGPAQLEHRLELVLDVGQDDQEVEVAVASLRAGGEGPEEHDLQWIGRNDERRHHVGQPLTGSATVVATVPEHHRRSHVCASFSSMTSMIGFYSGSTQ